MRSTPRVVFDCASEEVFVGASWQRCRVTYMRNDRVGTKPRGLYRVESFRIVGPCTMHVRFDDAAEQTVDLNDSGRRDNRSLRGIVPFEQVRANPGVRTKLWPNGADFDPSTSHDRPDQLPATKTHFRQGKHH